MASMIGQIDSATSVPMTIIAMRSTDFQKLEGSGARDRMIGASRGHRSVLCEVARHGR